MKMYLVKVGEFYVSDFHGILPEYRVIDGGRERFSGLHSLDLTSHRGDAHEFEHLSQAVSVLEAINEHGVEIGAKIVETVVQVTEKAVYTQKTFSETKQGGDL